VRGRRFAPALCFLALVPAIATSHAYAADCQDWVARTVSTQGRVEARRAGEPQWLPVRLGDIHCLGDAIRLGPLSRAAIVLRDGGVLRLDQNTTITFTPPAERVSTWIDLLTGAVHFFSRAPRGLRITTPFVNGTVEGTEFLVEVDPSEARISVWEGRVLAENPHGSLALTSGQSAAARAGQAPMLRPIVVRPTDAVAWTLYYPPVLDLRPEDFPDRPGETWPALARRSIEEAGRGDLAAALASVASIPDTVTEPRVFTYRAGLLLAVGRVDEALADIDRALRLAPQLGEALALRSVVAVAKNDRAAAVALAEQAIQSDPGSAAAHLALSYARQASFDLNGALTSVQRAAQLQPGNALARARLAELWLSSGNLDRAREVATEAVRLDAGNARAQTVLGFAALTQIRRREAAEAFERAIQLDPAAPLPRLGLGLTQIRGGDLEEGRRQLEIAMSLDPGDSLLRSYLGKAYYEERNPVLAADQFKLAEALDANDPTPWFYDAIRLQSVNKPVEALGSLQRSIELNDNRAVYRSRLLLDDDRAARTASLARIYDDLGFQQLAVVEGWRSLDADPANYSAHRFLADLYASLPRHEIARVSEILQSQLLGPLNLNPVPPQAAVANLRLFTGTGPGNPTFFEFNPLFNRNGLSLLASGVVGGNDTYGDEVVVSGLLDRFAISAGQYHFQTEGFRPNNDLRQDIYNVFGQAQLSSALSLMAEVRVTDFSEGDLNLRFNPDDFERNIRGSEKTQSFRLGARYSPTPESQLIGTIIYQHTDTDVTFDSGDKLNTDQDALAGESQYLYRSRRVGIVAGLGYAATERDRVDPSGPRTVESSSIGHVFPYLYSYLNTPWNVTLTLGVSADFLTGDIIDREQVNPKVGVTWNPWPDTTVRAALARTVERLLPQSQTLEPTQVAGFNQFYFDGNDTTAWLYGVGVDQVFSSNFFGGAAFSWRELEIPALLVDDPPVVLRNDSKERFGRAYLYWTPHPWFALAAEYFYERFERPLDFLNFGSSTDIETHRIPLTVGFFHPSGFLAALKATYVYQRADLGDNEVPGGSDHFWVLDASVGYRLPKRWGIITLEAKNLFNESFHFQDTDPAHPRLYPERLILLRLTIAY
jgi:tetratricopeptide (TPR) repeat protein